VTDRLRLAYGLHWPGRWPAVHPRRAVAVALATLAAVMAGLAMVLAGLAEARTAETAAARHVLAEQVAWKESYAQAMLACMNGGSFYFPDTKVGFICSATEVRL
jgi:hypothetical protein